MTTFKRQILSVLLSGAVLLGNGSSVLAATTLEISGNGSSSNNDVKVETQHDTTVVQSNSAVVTNSVSSSAKTGGNDANDNTGGDVLVRTGDATTDTTVSNTLNSNVARVDCCEAEDLDVLVSGNGSRSDNDVEVKSGRHDKTEIFQENKAVVANSVDSDAKTGDNDANRNTGGDVAVRTGNASATVDVSTTANANIATVGGAGDHTGSLSARILGNGSYSDNEVELELAREVTIVQDNLAAITNGVYADAKTGWNDANDNTAGEVMILTGDAETDVTVDNLVNFNAADIDCGCLMDVDAKIGGNGSDSDNKIKAELGGDREVFQGGYEGNGNLATLLNSVYGDSHTGKNGTDYNTGWDGSDPFIWTGDASSTTEVSNAGSVNVFGDGGHWEMPEFEWDFDFAHMMAFLGL